MVDGRSFADMVASRWRIHGDMGVDGPTFEIARLKSVVWRCYRSLDGETRLVWSNTRRKDWNYIYPDKL
jgi:hypothetical protein